MTHTLRKHTPTRFGGMMIIAGTAIGAGMLANPTATSGVWFTGSVLVLLYVWLSMYLSGLMLLEATLHFEHGASFHTVVRELLGSGWSLITGLAVTFVLYSLTYAYIFVGGGLTQNSVTHLTGLLTPQPLEISREWSSVLFLAVLATSVWVSTKVVDRFATLLISGMLVSFFLSTGSLLHSVSPAVLLDSQAPSAKRLKLLALCVGGVTCVFSFLWFPWQCAQFSQLLQQTGSACGAQYFVGLAVSLGYVFTMAIGSAG